MLTTARLKTILVDELPRLRRFAHGLTGNKPDADDLVQSLVEKVLVKQPDNTPEVPWLLRVCKNLWIDKVRTEQNREQLLQQNHEQTSTLQSQADTGPEDDKHNQIMAAIGQLSDDQKQLVTLVIVEGYSYAEAAKILEIPIGTVMSRIARARTKLMALISARPEIA